MNHIDLLILQAKTRVQSAQTFPILPLLISFYYTAILFTQVNLIILRPLLAGKIKDVILFIVSNAIEHLIPIHSVQVGVEVRQVIEGHHAPIGWVDLGNLICQPLQESTQSR